MRTIDQQNFNLAHLENIKTLMKRVKQIYLKNTNEVARIYDLIEKSNIDDLFHDPLVAKLIEDSLKDLAGNLNQLVIQSIDSSWMLSGAKNEVLLKKAIKSEAVLSRVMEKYYSRNIDALASFKKRVEGGLTISDRIWDTVKVQGSMIEQSMAVGIMKGTSAQELAINMQRYLDAPQILIEEVINLGLHDLMLDTSVMAGRGRGVYGSSYKNALRLTRTETNIAYHRADNETWNKEDFVVGVEIRRSGSGYDCDICEDLAGVYPKDIEFDGWHPNCYDKESEVYTKNGWKYFKDVKSEDLILSLNTETLNLEYTTIRHFIKYHYSGDMYHFFSRNFDLLVTPDHPMLLQKESDNDFLRMSAKEYHDKLLFVPSRNVYGSHYKNYRVAEWKGIEPEFIKIGTDDIPTDLYCELMGYYISEGSFSRKYAVIISQSTVNKDSYTKMLKCLNRLPYKIHKNKNGFFIYNENLYNHVKPFGKSYEKYVPDTIKNLSNKYIRIFLDAYNLGDGSIKKGRKWKDGNFKDILSYSTSSPKVASDVGELILKVGRRPTYHTMKTKGVIFKHRNGNYVSNHDIIIITEAYSKTAIQLNKKIISYDGYVYDLELKENHTMYIRRNGRCTWGSNCLCFAIPILASESDMLKSLDAEMDGRSFSFDSIEEYPSSYQKYKARGFKH